MYIKIQGTTYIAGLTVQLKDQNTTLKMWKTKHDYNITTTTKSP